MLLWPNLCVVKHHLKMLKTILQTILVTLGELYMCIWKMMSTLVQNIQSATLGRHSCWSRTTPMTRIGPEWIRHSGGVCRIEVMLTADRWSISSRLAVMMSKSRFGPQTAGPDCVVIFPAFWGSSRCGCESLFFCKISSYSVRSTLHIWKKLGANSKLLISN